MERVAEVGKAFLHDRALKWLRSRSDVPILVSTSSHDTQRGLCATSLHARYPGSQQRFRGRACSFDSWGNQVGTCFRHSGRCSVRRVSTFTTSLLFRITRGIEGCHNQGPTNGQAKSELKPYSQPKMYENILPPKCRPQFQYVRNPTLKCRPKLEHKFGRKFERTHLVIARKPPPARPLLPQQLPSLSLPKLQITQARLPRFCNDYHDQTHRSNDSWY